MCQKEEARRKLGTSLQGSPPGMVTQDAPNSPTTSCDKMSPLQPTKDTQHQNFYWGLATQEPPAGTHPRSRPPGRKARVLHEPYCLHETYCWHKQRRHGEPRFAMRRGTLQPSANFVSRDFTRWQPGLVRPQFLAQYVDSSGRTVKSLALSPVNYTSPEANKKPESRQVCLKFERP